MMGLRLVLVVAVLIALGGRASAQGAVDAERMRGAVQDYLDRLAADGTRHGFPPLRAGEITAVQQGKAVRLTISGLKIGGSAGEWLKIGPIDVSVIPDGNGRYRVAGVPPNHFDVVDGAGHPICRIAVGDQNWTGIWSTEIADFVRIDANMTDVGWRCAGSQNGFVSAIAIEMVMTETTGNRWRGHANLGLEGVSVREPAQPDLRFDLDHFQLTIAYANMDLDRRRDAIADNDALWRYATAATMRLEAAGLNLVSDIFAARGGFELSLTSHRDRGGTLTFEIVYAQDAEIAVAGTPTELGEIWLDLVFAGLALEALSPAKLSRMLDDPARLLAAVREITIRSVVVSTPRGEIRGTGTLRPARGNFPPVHGELTLETEDLAGLILDFLSRFGGPADQSYADAVRATVTELAIGIDPSVERFEIRIDRDGEISINRMDFAQIFALFQVHLNRR